MHRKWVSASIAIVSMWLAVLFVGLFAPNLVAEDVAGDRVELPLAVMVVGFFALVGTIVVAVFGLRGGGAEPKELHAEPNAELTRLRAEVAELRGWIASAQAEGEASSRVEQN